VCIRSISEEILGFLRVIEASSRSPTSPTTVLSFFGLLGHLLAKSLSRLSLEHCKTEHGRVLNKVTQAMPLICYSEAKERQEKRHYQDVQSSHRQQQQERITFARKGDDVDNYGSHWERHHSSIRDSYAAVMSLRGRQQDSSVFHVRGQLYLPRPRSAYVQKAQSTAQAAYASRNGSRNQFLVGSRPGISATSRPGTVGSTVDPTMRWFDDVGTGCSRPGTVGSKVRWFDDAGCTGVDNGLETIKATGRSELGVRELQLPRPVSRMRQAGEQTAQKRSTEAETARSTSSSRAGTGQGSLKKCVYQGALQSSVLRTPLLAQSQSQQTLVHTDRVCPYRMQAVVYR
jgi:hypothetical protein